MPQFEASLAVSTHFPLHATWAVGQQIPCVQCETIDVHARPHMPQLLSFD
jgi:hypothetical protein